MPSFFIFELRVVRLRPSLAAAPSSPPIWPFASRSARRIWSRSAAWRVGFSGTASASLLLRRFEFRERHVEDRAAGENDGTLEEVLQLADIARPGPARECVHGLVGNALDDLAHAAAVRGHKVAHQDGNVSGAFAQRRRENRKDLEAIIQIAAEIFSATILARSRLVAAIRRTFTWMGRVRPGAQSPAPAERATVWAVSRAASRRSRPETACLRGPVPVARSCGRSHR